MTDGDSDYTLFERTGTDADTQATDDEFATDGERVMTELACELRNTADAIELAAADYRDGDLSDHEADEWVRERLIKAPDPFDWGRLWRSRHD